VWEVWKVERKKIKNKNTFDFLKEESVMAKTKIAVLWGLLIAMMVACAGIYAALKARKQVFRRIAADAGVRKTNAPLRVSRRHKALDDARIAVTHVVKQALAHRLCAAHIRYGIPCKNNAIHIFKNHGKLPLKE